MNDQFAVLLRRRDEASTAAERDAAEIAMEDYVRQRFEADYGPSPIVRAESGARRRHRKRQWGFR